MRPPFYRGATGVIYTFDLTRRSSFASMQGWKEEVEKVIGPGKPCVLVGNKTDLADSGNREISEQEGEALRNEFNAGAYFETSAKQNLKVSPAFKELTLAILKASGKI